jgi:sugar lactone lactonase YvrE
MLSEVRCVLDAKAGIGESPVWSAEEQALYWVDILAPALYRFDPATGRSQSWWMPESIGAMGLREGGGAVVALRNGLHLLDLASGALSFLVPDPEDEEPDTRFNDGKVSPEGRFWVGTMDDAQHARPLAGLYRLDPDHSCRRVLDGLIISNGLAWSADARTLFHADTAAERIQMFDYDPQTGDISNPRVLAEGPQTGRPDGGATDVEGYYWSAAVSGGVLNRWAPDGRLDRQVALPCPRPTCPCFGGRDMRTLFVTSLRAGLNDEQLAKWPLAGGIFALEVEVPGVPVARFRG